MRGQQDDFLQRLLARRDAQRQGAAPNPAAAVANNQAANAQMQQAQQPRADRFLQELLIRHSEPSQPGN